MARPPKMGLDYFPLDVDIFDDFKMVDLADQYGPLGEAVYMRILCLVYREGYYCRIKSLDALSALIQRSIGSAWVKRDKVKDVICALAECGLIDRGLLAARILTSRAIQRRYILAAKRRKSVITEYRLVSETEEKELLGAVTAPQTPIPVSVNGVYVTETPVNVTETPQKESKKETENETENKRESKGGSAAFTLSRTRETGPEERSDVLRAAEAAGLELTDHSRNTLAYYLRRMEPDCIKAAIERTAFKEVRSPRYTVAILNRMLEDGITSREGLRARDRKTTGEPREKAEFERNSNAYLHYFDDDEEGNEP